MLFENLPHRRAHRKLPESRRLDFAADAEQLCASVFGPAQRSEPIGPVGHDVMNIAKRFDILDDGRFAPEPGNLRKWRLRSRMRPLSFERLQQRGLFAAAVTPGSDVKINFNAVARP